MKKKIFLLLVVCFLVTGCRAKYENVIKNFSKVENYSADVSLEISGTYNNEDISFTRQKFINIDNVNSKAKVKAVTTKDLFKDIETYYIKSNKDELTTYYKEDGYYISSTSSKDTNSIYYLSAFINQNNPSQFVESKGGVSHFVVTLSKDRVKKFLSSYYDVDILSDIDYEVTDSAKIHIYVYNKTKNLKSLSIDFSKIIKFNSSFELNKFNLEIYYTKFNSSEDVEIPNEYIKNSITKDVYEAYKKASSYLDGINSLGLNDTTTITDTTLIENITVDEVNLTIHKCNVISGYITVNNYKFKIESGTLCLPSEVKKITDEEV